MKIALETITPGDAKRFLESNNHNRPLNKTHISTLVKEIENGRWKVNGDAIRLSTNRLIDGQHRLHAVIESGIAIKTVVIREIADDVFDTIDAGKKRTGADTLYVRGEVDTNNLAASIAIVGQYMSGRTIGVGRYSNTEIEEIFENHPGIKDSLNQCRETKKLIPRSMMIACHYLFSKKDKTMADQFMQELVDGKNFSEGDPVYVLRERLMDNAMSKSKLRRNHLMALVVKAWNHKRSGAKIKILKLFSNEAFPVIL